MDNVSLYQIAFKVVFVAIIVIYFIILFVKKRKQHSEDKFNITKIIDNIMRDDTVDNISIIVKLSTNKLYKLVFRLKSIGKDSSISYDTKQRIDDAEKQVKRVLYERVFLQNKA